MERQLEPTICDLCKLEKDLFVVEKGTKTYVVCEECKIKIPEEEPVEKPKIESTAPKSSPNQQLKKEKKKFDEKEKRKKERVEKNTSEMVNLAIRSKSRTLFGGSGNTLF